MSLASLVSPTSLRPYLSSLALRQFRSTGLLAAAGAVDSPLFLLDYLLRFVRVAILLSLWRIVFGARGAVSGLPLDAVLTYTLISQVFADQLMVRTGVETAVWNGGIATRFLQPMSLPLQMLAGTAGGWGLGLVCFSLPLLLIAPLLGVRAVPADAASAALFVLSLALGVVVGLAVDFLYAGLLVTMRWNIWEVQRLRVAVETILSGSLLPLALLPWGMGAVFSWLPFAAMASAPLRIYTGTGDPLPLLLLQAGWAIVLCPAASWLWRSHRERLVIYGG
jgi:ABC-2 type transport system permease protein